MKDKLLHGSQHIPSKKLEINPLTKVTMTYKEEPGMIYLNLIQKIEKIDKVFEEILDVIEGKEIFDNLETYINISHNWVANHALKEVNDLLKK